MKVDVLIIGAGPTGLMAAREAVRHGLSCYIIDKATSTNPDESRAAAIQSRTLEIFSQVGLVDSFLKKGLKITMASPIYNCQPLAKIAFQHINSPYPFILSLQQAKTEKILKDSLISLGVEVQYGLECIDFYQTKTSVVATLRDVRTSSIKVVEASFLIGCDGAHSFVRKKLELSFEGKTFESVFSLADVCVNWPYSRDSVSTFFSRKGVLAAIPLPEEKRYRLIFSLPRCQKRFAEEKIAEPTFEEVQDFLQDLAGKDSKAFDPKWISNFYINSRLTSSYQKGRVFLAGDAAHIHSPIGGQGMNTGLQDVFNLMWKLALVRNKKAPFSYLESYHVERHSAAKTILAGTTRASLLATLQNPIAVSLRNKMIGYLGKSNSFQKLLSKALSQTDICYPQNEGVVGKKAGKRVPNVELLQEENKTTLYDLCKRTTQFQVMIFIEEENETLLTFVKDLIDKFDIYPFIISSCDLPKKTKGIYCKDLEKRAYKSYKLEEPFIYVIRPDMHIGLATPLYRAKSVIAYLTSWLRHPDS